MEATITRTQLNKEKIRNSNLSNILWWIEEAHIRIGGAELNLHNSHIAGEGVKYSNKIESLNKVISRLSISYSRLRNS